MKIWHIRSLKPCLFLGALPQLFFATAVRTLEALSQLFFATAIRILEVLLPLLLLTSAIRILEALSQLFFVTAVRILEVLSQLFFVTAVRILEVLPQLFFASCPLSAIEPNLGQQIVLELNQSAAGELVLGSDYASYKVYLDGGLDGG